MKKTLLLTTILGCAAFATPGLANGDSMPSAVAMPAPASNPAPAAKSSAVDGINVGVQVGYVTTDSELKVNEPTRPSSDKSDVSGQGVIGGIHLGWGHLVDDNVYVGLEANGNWSSADGKKNTATLVGPASASTEIEMTAAYDVSARLGYLYKNAVLPYLKAGVVWARWKEKTNIRAGTRSVGASESKHEIGFIGGAGVDVPVTDELTFGGEYTFAIHSSFKNTVRMDGNTIQTNKVEPRASSFMLNLRYKVVNSPF